MTERIHPLSCKSLASWVIIATIIGCSYPVVAEGQDKAVRIAVLGDSMSDGIWGGLLRLTSKEVCLRGRFAFGRYGENGTGLTRIDKFDWPAQANAVIEDFHPDLIVVSIGLNDNQSIVEPNKVRTDYATPAWNEKYKEIITRFLNAASPAAAGVLWVGNPVLRDRSAQLPSQERNRLFSEAITSFADPKVRYVKPWRLNVNADADDTFQAYGPDMNGSRAQIRATDGVHFTVLGYDLVTAYLMPIILNHLRQGEIEIPYPCVERSN
jgi:uncharacterized protein